MLALVDAVLGEGQLVSSSGELNAMNEHDDRDADQTDGDVGQRVGAPASGEVAVRALRIAELLGQPAEPGVDLGAVGLRARRRASR